jgi:hypothetical protein
MQEPLLAQPLDVHPVKLHCHYHLVDVRQEQVAPLRPLAGYQPLRPLAAEEDVREG